MRSLSSSDSDLISANRSYGSGFAQFLFVRNSGRELLKNVGINFGIQGMIGGDYVVEKEMLSICSTVWVELNLNKHLESR